MKSAFSLLVLLFSFTAVSQAQVSYTPWCYTDRDIFPSAIVSTATVDWNGDEESAEDVRSGKAKRLAKDELPLYGDENGWIAVDMSGLKKGMTVDVEISIDGFLKPSRWKGVVKRVSASGEARIVPKAAWNFDALLKASQERPVIATYKVSAGGEALPDVVKTFQMKSLNDCPFYVMWGDGDEDYDDISWVFAAYVNENHPEVDRILKEALATKLVDSFTGYQSEDPKEVMLQVYAVWNALQRRGIQYSDISTTTPSSAVSSQGVRFLDQSVNNAQANCVDGSVLMASVLRKIGLDAYLVMVPGHCLLAFAESEEEDADLIGLETTMLGDAKLTPLKNISKLTAKALEKEQQSSMRTFKKAVASGNESLSEHAEEFESEEDPDVQLISVSEARDFGIMPLPFLLGQ